MAYYQVEPFGEHRGDIRSAIVAQTVANVNRPKGRKPWTLDDFLPKYGQRATPEKSPEELLFLAEMINAAFGGVDLRESQGGGNASGTEGVQHGEPGEPDGRTGDRRGSVP
jgi:hypothetical protein